VFEVHDVVTGLERGDGLEGNTGAVSTRATQPAIAAEDLVVGENPETTGIMTREW
jgi:hypothetical protein